MCRFWSEVATIKPPSQVVQGSSFGGVTLRLSGEPLCGKNRLCDGELGVSLFVALVVVERMFAVCEPLGQMIFQMKHAVRGIAISWLWSLT
ncbi:Parapinopsin [Channa argus]|uniref:Parapinopsin n=1 Tax=Channa argus TaxID=215402 RepID=A0A6G1PHY3_CHAAH|nr:Parapinopsin [Channa argus]